MPAGEAADWSSLIEAVVEPGSSVPAHFSRTCSEKERILGTLPLPNWDGSVCGQSAGCLLWPRALSSPLLEGLSNGEIRPEPFIHSWLLDVPGFWDLETNTAVSVSLGSLQDAGGCMLSRDQGILSLRLRDLRLKFPSLGLLVLTPRISFSCLTCEFTEERFVISYLSSFDLLSIL